MATQVKAITIRLLAYGLLFFLLMAYHKLVAQKNLLPSWQEGYLDIHHINTARGNATFFIFPDGTTMLFDAGAKKIPAGKESEYFPIPSPDSLTPGGLMVAYIRAALSPLQPRLLNYALISHYHYDHYGQVDSSSPWSPGHLFQLSGITEVATKLKFGTLIDRGHSFPADLRTTYRTDATFQNYLAFCEALKASGVIIESLKAGSATQIRQRFQPDQYPDFMVRNLKVNGEFWSGKDSSTFSYQFNPPLTGPEGFDENPLGLALKVSYGKFDYYTGGDLPGRTGEQDYDMETVIASEVGQVEAMALNHHGYYDASNVGFLQILAPKIGVHQVIHDPHFQRSVLARIQQHPFTLFTYNMHASTKKLMKTLVKQLYASTSGHILIRVPPKGKEFRVYILELENNRLYVTHSFGPFDSYK